MNNNTQPKPPEAKKRIYYEAKNLSSMASPVLDWARENGMENYDSDLIIDFIDLERERIANIKGLNGDKQNLWAAILKIKKNKCGTFLHIPGKNKPHNEIGWTDNDFVADGMFTFCEDGRILFEDITKGEEQ
jgi:hypothetical protein